MRLDLADDPAVILIAERTGFQEDTVVGKLHRLWAWANRQLSNGDAPSVTKSWVDRYLFAPGFAEALIETGWLIQNESGVVFKDFDRWNSQGAKKRLLTARRNANLRLRKRDAASVTNALAKGEKRREENKDKDTPLPPKGGEEPAKAKKFNPLEIPLPYDTPAFRLAWAEWCEYRRVRKPLITELTAKKQLTLLAGLPGQEREACEWIERAIRNSWQGLYPERNAPGVSHPAPSMADRRAAVFAAARAKREAEHATG